MVGHTYEILNEYYGGLKVIYVYMCRPKPPPNDGNGLAHNLKIVSLTYFMVSEIYILTKFR